MKILLTGGSGGLGQAVRQRLEQHHEMVSPGRKELDLTDFASLDSLDLSSYDVLIHCAAANPGAYMGWHHNNWKNQKTQVDVNLTAGLFLLKQYTRQRTSGHFIYVTSSNIDDAWPQNLFYTTAKAAMRFAADTVKKHFPDVRITEICPGKIKTKMLEQNYQGSKTAEEIDEEYRRHPYLDPITVADVVAQCLAMPIEKITIVPYA